MLYHGNDENDCDDEDSYGDDEDDDYKYGVCLY